MKNLNELFIFISKVVNEQGLKSLWKVEKDFDQEMVFIRRNQEQNYFTDMSQAGTETSPPLAVKEENLQETVIRSIKETEILESSQFEWNELKIADLGQAYHNKNDLDQTELCQANCYQDDLKCFTVKNVPIKVSNEVNRKKIDVKKHQKMRKKKRKQKAKSQEKEPIRNPDKAASITDDKVRGELSYYNETKSRPFKSPIGAPVKPENQWLHHYDSKGQLQCPECDLKFQSYAIGHKHYQRVHKKIVCTYCPIKFSDRFLCNLHLEIFHGQWKGSYVCQLCSNRFSSKKILCYHERHFHNPKSLKNSKQCIKCEKEIKGSVPFLQHQFMNHLDCLELCQICNQPEFSKSELLLHMQSKHFHDYKSCQFCNLSFQDESTLSFHEDIVHYEKDLGPRNFVCHCGDFYTSQANLDKHQEVHKSGKKNFQLIPSGVLIKNKVSNGKGVVCHNKKQPQIPKGTSPHEVTPDNHSDTILCKVCGKLIKSGQMVRHMESHKHACQDCGKTYSSPYKLKSHILSIHLKIKLHCPVCSKEFSNRHVLKGHLSSVHSNQRHVCTFCHKSFKLKGDLSVHVRGGHEGKYVSCCICFKKFERTGDKNRHEKFVHNLVKTT